MYKNMVIFGTRPEAIKLFPVINALKQQSKMRCEVLVSAQHREMLDQVLDLFNIKPDYDLNVMRPGQDLYDVTSSVLLGMRDVLHQAAPDVVLVHGDTTTASSAAIAATAAAGVSGPVFSPPGVLLQPPNAAMLATDRAAASVQIFIGHTPSTCLSGSSLSAPGPSTLRPSTSRRRG